MNDAWELRLSNVGGLGEISYAETMFSNSRPRNWKKLQLFKIL